MLNPRSDRKALWLSLLLVHLALLVSLLFWLQTQTRPVSMPDLQLTQDQKLKCVSYAPFHQPGQTPFDSTLSIDREQISSDLLALSAITDCVRLYSVSQGLEQVPDVARELGLKVLLGAWIGFDQKANRSELDRALALANANTDVVRALIVGNEVLLRRERTEDELRVLIKDAKSRSQVPVTYADVWEFWTRHDSLATEVDFITVHILPFWEDEPVAIEHAVAHVADIRHKVGEHFKGQQILIGETGWPSAGRQRETSRPSQINQARYIREFVHQAHAQGWDYNLIEAIDQPWKRQLEGTVGGYWGMLEAGTLAPKFPLAGPVIERSTLYGPLGGITIGALLGFLLSTTGRATHCLRVSALTVSSALGGLITVLHWEHAHVAYRNALEWSVLGAIAALAAILPFVLARWYGEPIPPAATGWKALWQAQRLRAKAPSLGVLRGLLTFALAIAALLLWVDPRYRDFPIFLYLIPAAIFGVISWWRNAAGRAERICAAIALIAGIGRWLPEPANPQALMWLLTCCALALPTLIVRASKHQKR